MDKQKAIDIIKLIAKNGDIILFNGHQKWWQVWDTVGYYFIRDRQKKLFGPKSIWWNTHAAHYFEDGTFSVELPRAKYIQVDDYALDDITIYRYNKYDFKGSDILIQHTIADNIIGTYYDVGQLLDTYFDNVFGHPYDERTAWFDIGKKNMFCSAGTRTIFEGWRKKTGLAERLFSKLNKDNWPKEFIEGFEKHGNQWDIERTYPDNYSNTKRLFDWEYRCVLAMNQGIVNYQE